MALPGTNGQLHIQGAPGNPGKIGPAGPPGPKADQVKSAIKLVYLKRYDLCMMLTRWNI